MSEPTDTWTIKAALDWTAGFLERKGDEHARLSASGPFEATGLRRIDLYVNFERPLSMEERDILRGFVTRRASGEPLQYITGEVAFRHIAVKVRPGVLIPRPETEVLVSEALALLPAPERRCAVDSLSYAELEELLARKKRPTKSKRRKAGRAGSCARFPCALWWHVFAREAGVSRAPSPTKGPERVVATDLAPKPWRLRVKTPPLWA
ncbi:MAG: hypothetical protein ACLRX5_02560 [Slackia sp.]